MDVGEEIRIAPSRDISEQVVLFAFFVASLILSSSSSYAEERCLGCHQNPGLTTEKNGVSLSLFVDSNGYKNSIHGTFSCTVCHNEIDQEKLPHAEKIKPVSCGSCHYQPVQDWLASVHTLDVGGKGPAASCSDCHGKHDIIPVADDKSPVFRDNVPKLCGRCHTETGKSAVVVGKSVINVFTDYSQSVHGKGLTEKGLVVSAVCVDCHGAHDVRRSKDPISRTNKKNIPSTCGACHKGIEEKYAIGIHAFEGEETKPTCASCHSAHNITRTDMPDFMMQIAYQCGTCHSDVASTYMDTIHGKANILGYSRVAKCSDCHSPHDTHRVSDPKSEVGPGNRVATCAKCHERANKRFANFLTHASPENRDEYPILYYVHLFMVILLLSVFGFFGLHTLLWIPRSLQSAMRKKRKGKQPPSQTYIRRFTLSERLTHIFVVISFLILGITGMMLKFAGTGWAQFLVKIFGGVQAAGHWHRFCAIITFGYFSYHLYQVYKNKVAGGQSWKKFLLSGNSMVPNLQDFKDMYATVRWFLFLGPRPSYGRWTYWEKFDYFAVFWGVPIIGISGLMLWFPEFFTMFLPGWTINVAMIIHSEEALLAVGFIFIIHFFHTHLRPESFPLDDVIFTGVIPLERFKEERPTEYKNLVKEGKLEENLVGPPTEEMKKFANIFGFSALAVGIILIIFIFVTFFAKL